MLVSAFGLWAWSDSGKLFVAHSSLSGSAKRAVSMNENNVFGYH